MVATQFGERGSRCRSVGIMGYGHFGTFLHMLISRFFPQILVRIYDPITQPDGRTFFTLQEAAACDMFVFAVPIAEFETALLQALPFLGEETIIVDVATVKMHTEKILARHAKGRRQIWTHPMFGAESYQKRGNQVAGLTVVVTGSTLPNKILRAFSDSLKGVGLNVVQINARDHDWIIANSLFVNHYWGRVMDFAGFKRSSIDTVSFGFMMDAVESVKNDTKLFLDVYKFNEFCKEALRRIERGVHEVHQLLSGVA